MQKKKRLKPLSLYGPDFKEALHAMLSVDPRKLREGQEKPLTAKPSSSSTLERTKDDAKSLLRMI